MNFRNKKLYGTISLAVMALGSLGLDVLLASGWLKFWPWRLLAAGFQAGLIGGLADWYAVHVLLHPAPWFMRFWPFARHSNLLIRNRRKLEENIVTMVERELLSADKIWSHLEQLDLPAWLAQSPDNNQWISRLLAMVREQRLAAPLVELLDSPATAGAVRRMAGAAISHVEFAAEFGPALGRWLQAEVAVGRHRAMLRSLAEAAARNLRAPERREALRKWVREAALSELPAIEEKLRSEENLSVVVAWLQERLDQPAVSGLAARLCGSLLDDVVRSGAHDDFIERLLRDLCQWLATAPAVRQGIRGVVDGAISGYRAGKSGLRQIVVEVMQQVAIDREGVVDAILAEIVRFLNRVEQEPSHPLRLQWNVRLMDYAESLQGDDAVVSDRFDNVRKHLVSTYLRPSVERLISWTAQTFQEHATSDEAMPILDWLADWLDKVAGTLRVPSAALECGGSPPLSTAAEASASVGAPCVLQSEGKPSHSKVDHWANDLAERLIDGRIRPLDWLAKAARPLAEGENIPQALSWLKSRLQTAIADPQSALWVYLEKSAVELWRRTAQDPAERERLTAWAAAQSRQVLESQHHRLGAMVAASLDTYSDEQLIQAIDDKFGPDLQFIRLNGAVLGFLIGLALGAVSLALR